MLAASGQVFDARPDHLRQEAVKRVGARDLDDGVQPATEEADRWRQINGNGRELNISFGLLNDYVRRLKRKMKQGAVPRTLHQNAS